MKTLYQRKNILIIKFGGLGDFLLSLQAFNAIRKNHISDKLILLTEKKYIQIAKKCNWFDEIKSINRSLFYFVDRLKIKKEIVLPEIDFVYDLQTSNRSSSYIKLFDNLDIKWSGIAKNCSHPHTNQDRSKMHTSERFKDQLKHAGILDYPNLDFSWLIKNVKFKNFKNFAVIIPGGSSKRKYKRIPEFFFKRIIQMLLKINIRPILVGSKDDNSICQKLKKDYTISLKHKRLNI